jgi:hypothetical protein
MLNHTFSIVCVWAVVVSEVNIVRLEYRIFVGRKNLLPVLIIFFSRKEEKWCTK